MATHLDPPRLAPPSLDPGTDIGHVHLKVAHLEQALAEDGGYAMVVEALDVDDLLTAAVTEVT